MGSRLLPFVLVVLAGCGSAPPREDLPREHPAHPGAPTPEHDERPDPFAATTTFSVPGAALPGSRPDPAPGHAPAAYACPMHPEVVQTGPGACPECGMALRPTSAHAHDEPDDGDSRP